jgi:carbon dioxide concentrating mechanism protein CcmN
MQLLRPPLDSSSYIQGDVTIDPGAVIAPGVLLQAGPNSRIVIAAGVCLGMGVILQVHEGTLEVHSGASLGAGVLVVGAGKIGSNACIGTTSTLLNPSVASEQVIAPGSLLGEIGEKELRETGNGSSVTQGTQAEQVATPNQPQALASGPPIAGSPNSRENVPGAAYLNRLRSTLFPHEQSLKQTPP